MTKKMTLIFDPTIQRGIELKRAHKKIFEMRETEPEEFIMSAMFSALIDAMESGAKVFSIEGENNPKAHVFFNFKRV